MRGARLAKAWRRIDFLMPLPWQCTTIEPGRALYAQLDEVEAEECVVGLDLHGLSRRPTPRSAVRRSLAYAETPDGARTAVDRLADAFAAAEPRFAGRLWSADEAVAHAQRATGGRPIILADTQDNPGGGGSADTTGLLAALIAARAEGALLALLCDPEAAAGGPRGRARGRFYAACALGGRHGPAGVEPISGDFERSATGRRPVHRDRADVRRQPHGSRADGPAALRAAHRASRSPSPRAACRRPTGRSWHIWASIQRAGEFWRSRARSIFAPISSRLAEEVLVVAAPGANIADPASLPFRRLPAAIRRHPAFHSPVWLTTG